MDETTYRILDTLTRNLGRALSIQDLTDEMRRLHGSAYYANAYREVQALKKKGILQVARSGRTAAISLNFHSYTLIDDLTEMELRRKHAIMDHAKRAESIFMALERTLRALPIEAASTIDTERSLRLNRIELLLLSQEPSAQAIQESLSKLGRHSNLRIDHLALSSAELTELAGRDDRHPIPEMLRNELALYLPQIFWTTLAEAASKGQRIRTSKPIDLRRLDQRDLTYNLARFGYPLLGGAETGNDLCIESTATAALLSKDSRHRTGAAVLLAKNDFHPRLLAFLAAKHGVAGELVGFLDSIKPKAAVKELITQLGRARTKAVKPNTKAIKRAMEVYDAAK